MTMVMKNFRSRLRRSLRFTPTAWAKLLFWRDRGDTEIGGFGLSATDDLLGVTDVVLVPQAASPTFVRFDDAGVAIVARHGATYARLQWHVGPGGWQRLGVELDWTGPFPGTDGPAWAAEYDRCVRPLEPARHRRSGRRGPRADLAAADSAFDDDELLTTSIFRKGEVFPV